MKEGAVLVVAPRVEDLLVPYDAAHGGLWQSSVSRSAEMARGSKLRMCRTHRDVNHLYPVCVPHEIVGEHHGSLQASVFPSCRVRMSDV